MPRSILHFYRQSPAHYDELLDDDAQVRPHWRKLFKHFNSLTPAAMRARLDEAEEQVVADGVVYNVHADPDGNDRLWSLDPVPMLIAGDEWRQLATGLQQRARLFNAILADLYGKQSLLAEGLLPPALVFGQRGFYWPCIGMQQPGGIYLHQYAADLARSPDGRWWVIADRAQTPTGAGYALQNRIIVSRTFPGLYRDIRVQHLDRFFQALQSGLEYWAPVDPGERPLIVLLTPGPSHESYFEHVFLARHYGLPLVESADLAVRGDTLFLKTVTGLQRVHVVISRVPDGDCDPLELHGAQGQGVTGLLAVLRAGRVLMANAIGSGLLGSSALMGFLPAIARHLLDEELLVPSVATWWCGEQPALEHAIAHLDQLVIKPAYSNQRQEPIFGRQLNEAERADLIARLRNRPQAYVAQEWVNLAQAPVWSRLYERRLIARSVGLRAHLVATPNGYITLPGGLTRVANSANAPTLSMQRGGSTKDTWVLSNGRAETWLTQRRPIGVRGLVRASSNLSSRVVENFYWLGRYAERFDSSARLLRLALHRLIEDDDSEDLANLLALAENLGILPVPDKDAASQPLDARLASAVFDTYSSMSVAGAIRGVHSTARQLRDRVSLDHWQSLLQLQRDLAEAGFRRAEPSQVLAFLDRVLLMSSSLTGFMLDNMTRDQGWRFLTIARRIERLATLCETVGHFLLDHAENPADDMTWLLELADSIITYRTRYTSQPELLPTLDLVVFDPTNPHGIAFQLDAIDEAISAMEHELGAFAGPPPDAQAALRDFDVATLFDTPEPACKALAAVLFALQQAAYDLSDRISMQFFTHVDAIAHRTVGS